MVWPLLKSSSQQELSHLQWQSCVKLRYSFQQLAVTCLDRKPPKWVKCTRRVFIKRSPPQVIFSVTRFLHWLYQVSEEGVKQMHESSVFECFTVN